MDFYADLVIHTLLLTAVIIRYKGEQCQSNYREGLENVSESESMLAMADSTQTVVNCLV